MVPSQTIHLYYTYACAHAEEVMVQAMAGGGAIDPSGLMPSASSATKETVPQRFKTLFSRAGKSLEDWVHQKRARERIGAKLAAAGGAGMKSLASAGAPTRSDLARAGWRPDFGPESALAVGDVDAILHSEPGGAWYSDFEED